MATVYCFTSTGNSLYAAKRITEAIGGTILPMNNIPEFCSDNVIGLVFPCYYWGLPRIVVRFLSELRISRNDAYVFAVITSGGSGFGVLGTLTKLLKAKGLSICYGAALVAVTNYLPEYKVNDSEQRRQKTEKKLKRIVMEIKNGSTNQASLFTVFNSIVYKFFPDQKSDYHFTVSPTCVGCGTCEKVCPVNNIFMKGGRPSFRHNCEHCLGCLHNCPAEAIDWKEKTKGKKRYRHPAIGLDELISFNNRKMQTPR